MINCIHVSFGGGIIRVVVSFAVLVSLVARAVGVETNAVLVHARELAASGRWVEATAEVQKQLPSLKQPAEQANAHEMLGDPIRNANLQIERVRVLTFQMENSLAARKPADAIAPCRAIRAAVAELSKTFTSPQLQDWDQAAKQVLESQESPPK
jgi:hypothetical protein